MMSLNEGPVVADQSLNEGPVIADQSLNRDQLLILKLK